MNAVFQHGGNGRIDLRYAPATKPAIGHDTVLIEVELASLECVDTHDPVTLPAPVPTRIPGCQAVGTVIAAGPAVTRFAAGDRVVGHHPGGAFAELFAVPEATVWHLPEGIDPAFAAAVPHAFASAHATLFARGGLRQGETLLINGVTSAIGLILLQTAAQAGARVTGIAADASRQDTLTGYGLSHLIDRCGNDVLAACLEASDGRGFDFVVDTGLGADYDMLSRLTVSGGRYASFHRDNQHRDPRFAHFAIGLFAPMDDPAVHALVERELHRVARGEVEIPVEHEFALCEAGEAWAFTRRGGVYGRVVLRP
ncbi:NADPH:quinone reductase-like Zn-dependent oxidoreductase [Novosphingobium sp. PhB165]|uniref:quinone oxidoreductase family protein n=1 Tax=Novosphingobium sp. PhB165 TaxID=2485105 RepID=UPI00104ED16A|nr:zinc-binding alcohol dehydrogenase family protein [Novosphingobium sp. PhB165]TCM19605.1 NADPH:quinone reductase-like Zn-dependent oxidoreductase [Novosphingobium sp. PhB165]